MYIVVPSYKFNYGNIENIKSNVIEVSKDREVIFSGSKEEAKEKCKFYNSGGGFSGWTPSFVARKVEAKNDETELL